ncbi:hypothetical protein ACWCPT_35415, partial [Streptomyces sp. NPDC002308]
APANAGLRAQLKEGSPLLTENLLRTLLRAPNSYASANEWFSQAGTAAALPEDMRRIFADTLSRRPELRAAAYADASFREQLVGLLTLARDLEGVDGLREALRTEGRLLALFERDNFLVRLLNPPVNVLPALLRDESALLHLALAGESVTGALLENPDVIEDVTGHPQVLRALAAYENRVTPSPHWARLFADPDALAALDSQDGLALVRALASNPDLLTDALARDAFFENVKDTGRLHEYVELVRRSEKEFAQAIRATGEISITRNGIPVAAGPAHIARLILDTPDQIPAFLDRVPPEHREQYREAAEQTLRALNELPQLRGAVGREFGIILAMLENSELPSTLLKRPALIEKLADQTQGALQAIHDRPSLTAALRENGRLYLRFVNERQLVNALASPMYDDLASALATNRSYVRTYDRILPGALTDNVGVNVLRASEVVGAAVVEDPEVVTWLAGSPALVRKLFELFYVGEGRLMLQGPALEAPESTARALVSNTALLRTLAGRPELFDALAASPALSRALAENPRALTSRREVVGLLENRPLLDALEASEGQAAVLVGNAGLLTVAMRTPALVGAMAGSAQLSGLLRREDVRALLGEQPEVAQDLVRTPALVPVLGGLPRL